MLSATTLFSLCLLDLWRAYTNVLQSRKSFQYASGGVQALMHDAGVMPALQYLVAYHMETHMPCTPCAPGRYHMCNTKLSHLRRLCVYQSVLQVRYLALLTTLVGSGYGTVTLRPWKAWRCRSQKHLWQRTTKLPQQLLGSSSRLRSLVMT